MQRTARSGASLLTSAVAHGVTSQEGALRAPGMDKYSDSVSGGRVHLFAHFLSNHLSIEAGTLCVLPNITVTGNGGL